MKKYWMVLVEGGRTPEFRHPSNAAAKIEAERLARLNPGQVVCVLECVAMVRLDAPPTLPVKWLDIGLVDDSVPF
jgi:hypothetical protein